MNIDTASNMVPSLSHVGGGIELRARIEIGAPERVVAGKSWGERLSARLVFSGGKFGEHSLDIYASSEERVRAHWEGYCEANGIVPSFRPAPVVVAQPVVEAPKPVPAPVARVIRVGETVRFPSGSAKCGWRYGRVIKVGPKRAVIKYRFKYGRETTKSVPLKEIR